MARKARKYRASFENKMENVGQKFGKKFEKHFEKINYWYEGLSIVGPIIYSILRTIGFVIIVWILEFVNSFLQISLITSIDAFLLANMGLFFVVFLVFSFISFMVKNFPKLHFFLRPLFFAAGVAVAAWLAKSSIIASGAAIENQELFQAALYVQENLYSIFLLLLCVGYVVLAIDMMLKSVKGRPAWKHKRLYRSNKEKVIGGVCGGIAEYLGVDPVFIRLLWLLLALVWGYGVLLYLIAWIIIPHKSGRK